MDRRLLAAILIALAVGFTAGGVTGAMILIGPAGFRPAPASTPVAGFSPSPTAAHSPLPSTSPAADAVARSGAGMAFDASSGQMLIFGGVSNAGCPALPSFSNETWAWNGKQWTKLDVANPPSGRVSPALAYDIVHRTIVMTGGLSGSGVNDTWIWNGSRWLLQSPSQMPPTYTANFGGRVLQVPVNEPLFWDSARQSIELYAFTKLTPVWTTSYDVPDLDQIWAWDGSNWQLVPTSGTPPHAHGTSVANVAYSSALHELVFFGHVSTTATTWTLAGGSWSQPVTGGPTDQDFAVAADDTRSDVVMFTQSGETWTWDGARWTARNPVHSPGPRIGEALAYDPSAREVLLFGGSGGNGAPCQSYGDTWGWNGSDWTQLG